MFDTVPRDSYLRELSIPLPGPRKRATKRKVKRTPNWRSRSTAKTLLLQRQIRALLENATSGLTVAELGEAVGISRQLALYHVKKMAATYQLTMQLEPCLGNGGLQFRLWNDLQLGMRYAAFVNIAA